MCGIAGFSFNDENLILRMNLVQKSRGPDFQNYRLYSNLSLGHTRLAILDTTHRANQPFDYKQYTIVFNGEIYNFKEIKEKLKKYGHKFITNSDTEVILHAYEQYGQDCVLKFNGMWAFAILDKKNDTLFISRDRFGIKPLFFYSDSNKFIFASSIKAILQHNIDKSIDIETLNFYFYQKYAGADKTFFLKIKKLLPAHNLIFNIKTKKIDIVKYYFLKEEIKKNYFKNTEQKLLEIENLLTDSVEKRLIADVSLGTFLSGGIDSSLISAIAAQKQSKLNVFTIGFKHKTFDELKYAKTVADKLNLKHHFEILDIDDNLILTVIEKMDEPFADPAVIPTYLLCEITRKNVTVALSGDGADEIFAGYETYLAEKMARKIPYFVVYPLSEIIKKIPVNKKSYNELEKIYRFFAYFDKDIIVRHKNWLSQTDKSITANLLADNYINIPAKYFVSQTSTNSLLDIQLDDFTYYLPDDILRKTDMISMMHSLEVRVPFLDHRLVPIVLSMPDNMKIRLFNTKYILKKIADKYLPQQITSRQKHGFTVPLSFWIKKSEKLRQIITDKNFYKHNLIDYDYANLLLKDHLAGKQDNFRPLWLIIVINYWFYTNF